MGLNHRLKPRNRPADSDGTGPTRVQYYCPWQKDRKHKRDFKYTKDLAAHFKDTNILVNALDPGWLKTDLGGENADHEVETVLPGALVPALLEDFSKSGIIYSAQEYKTILHYEESTTE